jgi:putative colanic acid biosysnthesis UDP-glucose lipid carrier transferase
MSQRLIAIDTRSSPVASGARGLQLSYQAVGGLVGFAEVIAIIVSSLAGEALYNQIVGREMIGVDSIVGVGMMASLLYGLLAKSYGLYRLPALIKPGRYLKRIFVVCALVVLALTTILYLMKVERDFSRGTWLSFAPLMLASCCAIRIGAANIITALLDRDAITGRRAFLVGEAEELMRVNSSYLLHHFGLREVGRASLDRIRIGNTSLDPSRIADALEQARESRAKEFIVVAKWDSTERLNAIEQGFRVSPLPVRLLPNHVFRSVVHRHGPHENCAVHLIDLQRSPMNFGELAAKRAMDIVLAAVGIVLLLPVFLITAMAIKLDSPGPIIFRQRRNGFNQDQFVIYKFRTMTVLEDDEKVIQAKKGDKRVTRVGQLLRRSSVDPRRPSSARAGARPRIQQHHRRLLPASSRQAGDHGLGAGSWLPGRNRPDRADAAPRRPRRLVYQQLVALDRHPHPHPDLLRAGQARGLLSPAPTVRAGAERLSRRAEAARPWPLRWPILRPFQAT